MELKAGLLTRCFRRVFGGREEHLLVWTLTFLTFKIFYTHKNVYKNTEGEGKKTIKHNLKYPDPSLGFQMETLEWRYNSDIKKNTAIVQK